ncbi:hypothetical protein H5410_056621 [Solanum commersonii]|uniref:Uncharacterized protein n=1 Tax=Solanum commersonii TaxID=4109 RepID=A0A9J5WMR1_SOLCO|nr:hypothetical protein H5410_056621 [Solanum commersonii]
MDDWDKWWLGDGYPCQYCEGLHLDIECPNIKRVGLEHLQNIFIGLCHICGGQYGYENGCPNSYAPPLNLNYDSSIIFYVGRNIEVKNAKHEAQSMNLFEQRVEQKEEFQPFNYTLFLSVNV